MWKAVAIDIYKITPFQKIAVFGYSRPFLLKYKSGLSK